MTVTTTEAPATPDITTEAACPHWWIGACDVRYPGIHECAGRLFHASGHRCACGAVQSR